MKSFAFDSVGICVKVFLLHLVSFIIFAHKNTTFIFVAYIQLFRDLTCVKDILGELL